MYEITAQLLGYIGLIFSVLSFQFNSGKRFFTLQMLMKLSFFVNLLMLRGYSGAILNGLGFFNCAVYWFEENGKRLASKKTWMYVFAVLYVAAGLTVFFITSSPRELLPTAGALATAVMFSFGSVRVCRIFQLCAVSPCWIVYHYLVNSQGGIVCEAINITSVIFALIRYRKPLERLALRCAAKINLVLSVPSRLDDGYHEISTVMQTVGLFDRITVRKAEGIKVVSDKAPCGEDNICYKAALLFSEFGGAEIEIEKNIPMLSGLGGGSADAAGVLLALNSLYGEPFAEEELIEKALSLGSDVPFFIKGGTALIEGKGEKITPCADYFAHLVLVKHGKKQSTGQMYRDLDENGLKDRRDKVAAFCDALESGADVTCFNDFESVYGCEDIKNALLICGASAACLSGSGPTVFGVFDSEQKARECAEKLSAGYDEVYYCPTVKSAIIFE